MRGAGAWLVRLACGLQAIFTASRMVRRPVASLAGVGRWGSGRWSFLDQEPQEPGFRAQRRGAMPLAALRGRLRGERPRSEGRGDTVRLGCCLWLRSGSLVASRPEGNRPADARDPEPTSRRDRAAAAHHAADIGRRRCCQGEKMATPRELGSGSLVASAQTAAHDGPTVSSPCHTKPPPDQPDRRRHGLYSGGPSWYSQPQRRDEGSGPEPQAAPQPASVPPPLRARPLAAQAPPEGRQRHRAPGLGAKACRLWP